MNLVVALRHATKALRQVRAHLREGLPVRAYVRSGRDAAKLFEAHYRRVEQWLSQAIRHLHKMGVHVDSDDDAFQVGAEAVLLSLRSYNAAKGPIENYVRKTISLALKKYIATEKARGMTGTRSLLDKMYAASTAEAREKVLREFPRVEEVQETLGSPSLEEAIESGRELLRRDEVLGDMERELGVSMERIREHLNQREKKTWKKRNLADRKLKVYLLRLEGWSFREISKRLSVDAGDAYRDFKQVSQLLQQGYETRLGMAKAVDVEKLRDWRLRRLAFAMDRLAVAAREKFPSRHIEFIRHVVIDLLLDLELDERHD